MCVFEPTSSHIDVKVTSHMRHVTSTLDVEFSQEVIGNLVRHP
jgi:hypothetical protein